MNHKFLIHPKSSPHSHTTTLIYPYGWTLIYPFEVFPHLLTTNGVFSLQHKPRFLWVYPGLVDTKKTMKNESVIETSHYPLLISYSQNTVFIIVFSSFNFLSGLAEIFWYSNYDKFPNVLNWLPFPHVQQNTILHTIFQKYHYILSVRHKAFFFLLR